MSEHAKLYTDSGENALVTDEVVESAELRAKAVEAAREFCLTNLVPLLTNLLDCTAQYTPMELMNILQNMNVQLGNIAQRMDNLEQGMGNIAQHMDNLEQGMGNIMALITANTQNLRLTSRNLQVVSQAGIQEYLPLQKVVSTSFD